MVHGVAEKDHRMADSIARKRSAAVAILLTKVVHPSLITLSLITYDLITDCLALLSICSSAAYLAVACLA